MARRPRSVRLGTDRPLGQKGRPEAQRQGGLPHPGHALPPQRRHRRPRRPVPKAPTRTRRSTRRPHPQEREDRRGPACQGPRGASDPPYRQHQPVRADVRRTSRRPRRSSRANGPRLLRAPKRSAARLLHRGRGPAPGRRRRQRTPPDRLPHHQRLLPLRDHQHHRPPPQPRPRRPHKNGQRPRRALRPALHPEHAGRQEDIHRTAHPPRPRPLRRPRQPLHLLRRRIRTTRQSRTPGRLHRPRPPGARRLRRHDQPSARPRHLVAHGHTGTTTKPVKDLGTHHESFDDLATACAAAAATAPTPAGRP